MHHGGKIKEFHTWFYSKPAALIFPSPSCVHLYSDAVYASYVQRCYKACLFSHQQTVEKDMDKHPQRADDEVEEVVEKLKVHNHSFVASREGSSVPHKTYQEDDFITHL